jgi:MarR family transcriptional regulator, lower aerobic nicotinate degradation pathway regulator
VVVTRPTVTGLLNSLESQGLIRREADPADGRRVRISLTRAGRERVEALLPAVFGLEKELFSELSAREKETLLTLLAKVQTTALAASRGKPSEPGGSRRAPPGLA